MRNGVKRMSSSSDCLQSKTKWKSGLWIIFAILCTGLIMLLSLQLGVKSMSIAELIRVFFNPAKDVSTANIIYLVRLPRMLACIVCGGALATSGLLIQTILHTPLASPGIIGVNSGAGFAVVLVSVLFPAAFFPRMIGAFVGSLITVLLIYFIGSKTGASKLTIVLAGIAVSSFLVALSDTLITINPSAVIDKATFSIGGFSGVGFRQVLYAIPIVVLCLLGALYIAKNLEVLTMGDEVAKSLGVPIHKMRFIALFIAALLAASAVSIGGLIGFVGLVVPHIARLLFKSRFTKLVPFCFWLGSIFVLVCDLLARILFKPYELPAGIVLSFIGVPFFLFLLFKKRSGKRA